MRFDALRALRKFKDFASRGKGHKIWIASDDVNNLEVITLVCEYSGKYRDGVVAGRIEVCQFSEKGDINALLYSTFDDLNARMNSFDKPEREDCFV